MLSMHALRDSGTYSRDKATYWWRMSSRGQTPLFEQTLALSHKSQKMRATTKIR